MVGAWCVNKKHDVSSRTKKLPRSSVAASFSSSRSKQATAHASLANDEAAQTLITVHSKTTCVGMTLSDIDACCRDIG
eukprot:g56068.t1